MARFYSTFDNSTVAALEATTTGNRFQRAVMTGGAGLKSTLLAARTALSSAVYADMATVDQDGTRGVVMPTDGYSRGGGNLTWTELYTNPAAEWQSNPRTRPTTGITVSGSTIISPCVADGSVTETLYTDAQTALQNAIGGIAAVRGGSGAGPYSYLGQNPFRTLLSIWHDHDMTYIGWDDFSPGAVAVGSFLAAGPGTQGASFDLTITFSWSQTYPADLDGNIRINATLDRNGGGASTSLTNQMATAASGSYAWIIPGGTLTAGTYTLDSYGEFQDATITTHYGTSDDDYDASFVILT